MSEQPPEEPQAALEPDTLPEQPLTAAKAACFIEKEIGLP